MTDIEKAKSLLVGNATCVLVKGDEVLLSEETGIKPMLGFIQREIDLSGFSVADKIVGKAAAMLFAYAKTGEVYSEVLSRSAVKVLEKYNIKYSYGVLTDNIINRRGDGICPMEQTVAEIDDPIDALKALKAKLQSMQNGSFKS